MLNLCTGGAKILQSRRSGSENCFFGTADRSVAGRCGNFDLKRRWPAGVANGGGHAELPGLSAISYGYQY
jgi:hypothetical protein